MDTHLLTVADFTSVLEIGVGLNLAASYVSVFVSPLLDQARIELAKFRWLLDEPARAQSVLRQNCTVADLEDKYVQWERKFDSLEKAVERVRKRPTLYSVAAAIFCLSLLFFPNLHVDLFGLIGFCFLVLAPSALGATYVWLSTRKAREDERRAAAKTKALIG